jgi:hypothetical protein
MKTDWKLIYRRRLASDEFSNSVKMHLGGIRSAPREKRPSLAAQFAGWLRLRRSYVRVELTRALAEELGIVTTQKVALMLMHTAFGAGTSKDFINDKFAKTGRTAATKYMDAAQQQVAQHTELIADYTDVYEWYCAQLMERIEVIKLGNGYAPQPKKKAGTRDVAAGYITERSALSQGDLFA